MCQHSSSLPTRGIISNGGRYRRLPHASIDNANSAVFPTLSTNLTKPALCFLSARRDFQNIRSHARIHTLAERFHIAVSRHRDRSLLIPLSVLLFFATVFERLDDHPPPYTCSAASCVKPKGRENRREGYIFFIYYLFRASRVVDYTFFNSRC